MAGAERDEACAHFVAKWQQREPEMVFAEVFCPPADKPRFRAWGALLHEVREALFELSDPAVTRAKSTWWAEELLGMAQGRAQHPLTIALVQESAAWAGLSRAVLEQAQEPALAADTAEALALLQPLAAAVTQIEAELFRADTNEAARRALAVHWLLQRLPAGLSASDRARLPMHLLARHGMDTAALADDSVNALLRDWAGELLQAAPDAAPGAAWLRRSRLRFDRSRLRNLAQGQPAAPLAPWSSLWQSWRAARSP